jgi:serine/threonine-protein kinase
VDTTLQDPLVGRVLDGRYHVNSRLARGGMATVYLALDSRLDREIALKVMHPGLAEDEEFVSRFIREARSAARLSHPNVVAVHDQGADAGHVFLAMEYVSGRTLRDLLRERGRLSVREALDVLESVAAALGAAHHAGLVHRDVKPENVLLADDGRIKVADFGLARAVSAASNLTSATGVVMGTVAYLAPEQVDRGIADPRSDVYAAGILLFEMLTGAKPYRGESAIQIAYQHVHDDVPPPSSVVPALPQQVDALVARATCRDPDGRPEDARRLLTEVALARRSLSDAHLDAIPAPLRQGDGDAEHTVVVPIALPGRQRRGPPRSPADPEPLPARRRERRSHRGGTALVLVLLLAAALSVAAWWVVAGPGAYTAAPRLIELPEDEAAAKARAEGFSMRVTARSFDETMPAGHVISTEPGPTESIRRNGTIGVVLSKGPERYAVPELRGKTRAEAGALLRATHLTMGAVTQAYHDTIERDRVISTTPTSGIRLKRDQAVGVVISKGVEPVVVPDVVGDRVEQAKTVLAEAPLRFTVKEIYNEKVAVGRVISQRPASGGKAPKNSEVALVVSKGPPPVPVPVVVGYSLGEARRMLIAAGFGAPRVYNLPGGPDRVLDQSPNGGSAPKGSSITLSVF